MKGHHFSFDTPPARLHMVDYGGEARPPLLLLHGMAGNSGWWEESAALLSRQFHTVALDFRGHGESGWPEPPNYEIDDYAADIGRAAQCLGWKRFSLAAHSMGARAALAYASLHPEAVRALAAVDFLPSLTGDVSRKFSRPTLVEQPHYPSEESILIRFRLEPRGTRLAAAKLRALGRRCVRRLEDGSWTWKFDFRAFRFRYTPVWNLLPKVHVPTLVLRGEHSTVMRDVDYRKVLKEIPDGRGLVLPGAHHHLMLDDPMGAAEALADWFGTQPD